MHTQEELRQILSAEPDRFDALCEMSGLLHREGNFAGCFAMLERAIASYEATPDEAEQSRYFDMKRFRSHLLRSRLPEILGPVYPLLDLRWTPVFKLGRIREVAWRLNASNIPYIPAAVQSQMMRRVRFLSIVFDEYTDEALALFCGLFPDSLRVLSLTFNEMPQHSGFMRFWQQHSESGIFKDVVALTVSMPTMNDAYASLMRNAFGSLESLSLISLYRGNITGNFCEEIADDPRSNALTRLALVGTNIGDDGLFTLLSSENFSSLQVLDVHDGILTNASARVLSAEHNLSRLRSIDLSYNRIDPAGVDMVRRTSIEANVEGQHSRPI